LEKLPKSPTASIGGVTSSVSAKNVKGEVTEHGIYVAPRAGYYFDTMSDLEFGIEIEPEFMVSISSDVKANRGDLENEIENAIENQLRFANLSYETVTGTGENDLNLFTDENLDNASSANTSEEVRIVKTAVARAFLEARGESGNSAAEDAFIATTDDEAKYLLGLGELGQEQQDDLAEQAGVIAMQLNSAEQTAFAKAFPVEYQKQLRNSGANVSQQLAFADTADAAAKGTVVAAEANADNANTAAQSAFELFAGNVSAAETANMAAQTNASDAVVFLMTSMAANMAAQTNASDAATAAMQAIAANMGAEENAATMQAVVDTEMANTAAQNAFELFAGNVSAAEMANMAAQTNASDAATAAMQAVAANAAVLNRPIVTNLFPSINNVVATPTPQGGAQVSNLDDSPTLFHATVPIYAVANFRSETATAKLGVGTGIMFYDLGDKVNGGASWPILVKAGLHYPFRDNMTIGGDIRFHYSLTSPKDVDSIWGIRAGLALTYFFQ